jgi:N-acetylmuramoyl-L-alanine amidase
LLTLATQLTAQTVRIKNVRIAHTADRTRIVLDLDRGSVHRLFTLANPNRVVIDLQNTDFRLGGANLPAGAGAVARVRGSNRPDGSARLVLDLDQTVRPESFALQPGGGVGHRVVIDLMPTATFVVTGPGPAAIPAAVPARSSAPAAAAAPVVVKRAPGRGNRDIVIAIDPGHGGKDPGARGRGGLREKQAVLQIGKRLASLIDAEPGMKAFMTRSDDRFLQLRERQARAEKAGADLFISIHADAFSDRRVGGATVYVLSEKGASDEAAQLVAQRENAADLIGGVDIASKDDMLASVLVDLSQNASLEASVEVGDLLIAEMSRIGKMRKTRVQKAGFMVLKSPDIPSILVETAFISNPREESNLKSVQYQQRLAQAMHNGVRTYFYANPPTGSRIARLSQERRFARQHVIRRGDTLSEIAQRYNVSVSRIRTENKISGNRIMIGQVLRIPPA